MSGPDVSEREKQLNIFKYEDPEQDIQVRLVFPDDVDTSKLAFNPRYFIFLQNLIGLSKITITFSHLGQDMLEVSIAGNNGQTVTAHSTKVIHAKVGESQLDSNMLDLNLIPNAKRKVPAKFAINLDKILGQIRSKNQPTNEVKEYVPFLNEYLDSMFMDIIFERLKNLSEDDKEAMKVQLILAMMIPIAAIPHIFLGSVQSYIALTTLLELFFYGVALVGAAGTSLQETSPLVNPKSIGEYRFDPLMPLGPQLSRTLIAIASALIRKGNLNLTEHFGVLDKLEG